ncbi:hypothetical protein [Acuticoccus sediminis]|uniref:hypothetical protein n=1 Tax=Acuticoccus sediminis TaxID=2184697 RepID=UPI001CFC4D91|nr:hypothetical protein [Acuticoccus sediminis]
MIVINKVWLLPPLAFGRVGSAGRPCQAYSWSAPPVSPDISSKTTLVPEETIDLDADGNATVTPADAFGAIALKDDDDRFFPVCPFFELHGAWTDDGTEHEGPVTEAVLNGAGLGLGDVMWSVTVANLKPYHYTLRDGDRVEATAEAAATDTVRKSLAAGSPGPEAQRLVPSGAAVVLGAIQAVRPSAELPGLRLRVYAPAGVVYGPTDLAARIATDPQWRDFQLPAERRVLNPQSGWATAIIGGLGAPGPVPRDQRVSPQGLAATLRGGRSVGLVDDVSDGLVRCTVAGLPTAFARVAVGPPDFAPAARPFVSLQDGLADRMRRTDVADAALSMDELEAVVGDILERALETSDMMNKDAQAGRSRATNGTPGLPPPSADAEAPPIGTMWPAAAADGNLATRVDSMPVTFAGNRKHRRLNALQYLKDRLRDDPSFVERWLRPPRDQFGVFDRRMPALMRGSDGQPMHLSRRQYELVRLWSRKVTGV